MRWSRDQETFKGKKVAMEECKFNTENRQCTWKQSGNRLVTH